MEIELKSTITCPNCGHQKEEEMPTNACQYFYECESCKTRLKPLQGDCCVYCSYGTVKCPPIQQNKSCCNWRTKNGLHITAVWQNGGFSAKLKCSSSIELLCKTEHLYLDFRHFAKLQNVGGNHWPTKRRKD